MLVRSAPLSPPCSFPLLSEGGFSCPDDPGAVEGGGELAVIHRNTAVASLWATPSHFASVQQVITSVDPVHSESRPMPVIMTAGAMAAFHDIHFSVPPIDF